MKEWKELFKFAVIETLFVAGFWLWMIAVGLAQTGTAQTKPALNTETSTNFPDNSSGLITPLITRQSLVDFIASWEQAQKVRTVVSTSDTLLNTDTGWLVTYNNSANVAVSLPQAAGTFLVWDATLCNLNPTSVVTVTPTTSTIGGATTATMGFGQCLHVTSDGTNYQTGNPLSQWVANSSTPYNCGLTTSVATNLLTVTLTDNNGNNPSLQSPCVIPFRSATATTGQLVNRYVTAALTINTNATGATLGSVNAQAFRFWVVAFDNGGTVVLSLYNAWTDTVTALNGVYNCSPINEGVVQSSTAISGSATSAGVFYTPNGTTLSNKSIRILGYVEYNSSGLATAGTYASAPNFVQVFGTGIHRPCEPVQTISFITTSQTTTTSASFVTSVLNSTITPTGSANRVRVEWWGTLSDSGSAGTALLALFRGANACTTQISGTTRLNSAANSVLTTSSGVFIDHPNTVSSQGYTLCIANTNAATTTWPEISAGDTGNLYMTEIMG